MALTPCCRPRRWRRSWQRPCPNRAPSGTHRGESEGPERLRGELPEVAEADGAHELRVLARGVAHADGVEPRVEHGAEGLEGRAVGEHAEHVLRDQAEVLQRGAADLPGGAGLDLIEYPPGEVRLREDVADVHLAVGVDVKHGDAVADGGAWTRRRRGQGAR